MTAARWFPTVTASSAIIIRHSLITSPSRIQPLRDTSKAVLIHVMIPALVLIIIIPWSPSWLSVRTAVTLHSSHIIFIHVSVRAPWGPEEFSELNLAISNALLRWLVVEHEIIYRVNVNQNPKSLPMLNIARPREMQLSIQPGGHHDVQRE
jgi:hypothetical protein